MPSGVPGGGALPGMDKVHRPGQNKKGTPRGEEVFEHGV